MCPTVYSLNSDGGQDDLLCSYVNVDPGKGNNHLYSPSVGSTDTTNSVHFDELNC